jgi:DnaK suppressor protein
MTRDDARLRRLLEEERSQLLNELNHFQAITYDDVSAGNHLADSGTTAYDQASDLALRRQIERRLQRIEHALKKFATNTYGYCENCGEPIDFARLKALPDARFCLRCQRQRETAGAPMPGPRAFEEGRFHSHSEKDDTV